MKKVTFYCIFISYPSNQTADEIYPAKTNDIFHRYDKNPGKFYVNATGQAMGIELKFEKQFGLTYKWEIMSGGKVIGESNKYFCLCNRRLFQSYRAECTVTFPVLELLNLGAELPHAEDMREYFEFCKKENSLLLTFKCGDVAVETVASLMMFKSPVINAMMRSNCVEAQTKIVQITDFSEKSIRKMIEFCESGQVEEPDMYEMELYKLADKYDMEQLKDFALLLVKDMIGGKCVIQVFEFARTYDIETLENECAEFGRDYWLEVRDTADIDNVSGGMVKEFWLAVRNFETDELG